MLPSFKAALGGVAGAVAALGGAGNTTTRSSKAALQQRKEYVVRGKFKLPVSLREVERDWASQGFHCGCMIDPPGKAWENFTHTANELVTVVEGRMRFTLMGEYVFDLVPGDEIFIPAGVPHSTLNTADGNSKWYYGYDGAANSWF